MRTKSKASSTKEVLVGRQEPSVRIVPKYSNSDGTDAEKILQIGGIILDPWQAEILDDWLAMTPGKKWVCKTCGGSVPRQNGKTGLVQGRANTGMIMYNEQVIYTAHLQKTATETFEEMASFFDSPKLRKYIKDIKTALGREQIILTNGARVKFLARTRNGGRGQHGDLLIFDEAQELDEEAQASFLPAISASLNPQTIYVGTPPDSVSSGYVFRSIRKRAIDGETKQASWFEFSVKEIGEVTDKKRWAETNPALGRRILLSTIEGECEQMSPDIFARERLGWWSPMIENREDYAIPEKIWMDCISSEPKPEGRMAYGVKFSADGSMVALCGAVIPNEGPSRISLIDYRPTGEGLKWIADILNPGYMKASCVVIDGRNGVDVLVDKISDVWKFKGSIVRPNVKEVIASVSMLCDALNEQTVTWFEKQELLKESAITATKRQIAGGWGFGGDDSAPIEACALAFYGAKTSKRNPSKKMLIG